MDTLIAMAIPKNKPFIEIEEYYRAEELATEKHEYFRGEIFAMAGGSVNHATISANIQGSLWNRLKGTPCRTLSSDARIRVMATGLTSYPDAAVVCGDVKTDLGDLTRSTIINPTVLFEVLSPTTEGYDRGAKFANYQRIESLREYIIVSQDRPFVECFRRRESGHWDYISFDGLAAIAKVEALSIDLPLGELYERIDFSESAVAAVPQGG